MYHDKNIKRANLLHIKMDISLFHSYMAELLIYLYSYHLFCLWKVRTASLTCFAGITSSAFIFLSKEKQEFVVSSLVSICATFTCNHVCFLKGVDGKKSLSLSPKFLFKCMNYTSKIFVGQCCCR